ncbi:MAG: glycosyltransferase family 39 protein [Ktedonobacteraceae bacterium]|nr:glycosyltransferase family 39 protein [Ktedonobacteraceae bacterium]
MISLKKFSFPGGADAWKAATGIFLISRLIIFICTYLAWSRFIVNDPVYAQGTHECMSHRRLCFEAWSQFDAKYFVGIAQYGYGGYNGYVGYNPQHPYATAFFPLYPMLIHGVGFLFGGSWIADYVASLLVANLCFFFVLVLLYCMVRRDFDGSIAQRSLFFLAFNPYAIFFFLGYTESLFLLLCLGALFFLRRGRPLDWWLAGLCGAGAVLTRGNGVVLLIAFSVAFLQHFGPALRAWYEQKSSIFKEGRWRTLLNALLPMGLFPLALGAYMFYLWFNWHNPLLFSYAEVRYWGRILAWPWVGTARTIQNLLFTTQWRDARNLTDLIFTFVPIAIVIWGWRRLPLDYIVFALAIAIFSLMFPWFTNHPLASTPRYLMMMFPVGVMLAVWSKRPAVGKAFELIWVTFFVVNTVLIVLENWVA